MFCTECGTQIDQGKKFCWNCGAKMDVVGQVTADPGNAASTTTPADISPRQEKKANVESPSRAESGNNKLIIVAAGVGVFVLAAAGLYFGTDLIKPTANQPPARIAAPMAKDADSPPLPSFEETRNAGTSVVPPSPSEPVSQVEPPKLPLETLPKGEARADLQQPSKSPMQRAGQEAVSGRVSPASPGASASRVGATPGIYETKRTTDVYEDPSASSKVIASIAAGTHVTVVGSNGDWLEVHSRRGNPPGFIRRGDATFVEKSN